MKLKSADLVDHWEDKLLPKIPTSEIYLPPKDLNDLDADRPASFRGRSLTIGNGQIQRLVEHDNAVDSNDPTKVLKNRLDLLKIKVIAPSYVVLSARAVVCWRPLPIG